MALCLAAALLLAAAGPLRLGAAPPPMAVHLLDVGQGDAILLSMPNGQHVLVDGGPAEAGPSIVAYLEQHAVERLDLVVATHAHADHIGGLADVIASVPVAAVWADSWDCTTLICHTFYSSISARGIVTATARAGQLLAWGDVQGLVVHPGEPLSASANDRSVVLRVTYGDVSVLLTGDAESLAETQMLARGLPLQAQLLKVAHHGSDTSSSASFLRAVGAEQALISVGAANPYGHPGQATLERLTASGAEIWRTDLDGAIVATIDGRAYRVAAESGRKYPEEWRAAIHLPLVLHMVVAATP